MRFLWPADFSRLGEAKIDKIWIEQRGKQVFSSKYLRDGEKFVFLQHENPPSLFAMLKSAGRLFLYLYYGKQSSFSETILQFPRIRYAIHQAFMPFS